MYIRNIIHLLNTFNKHVRPLIVLSFNLPKPTRLDALSSSPATSAPLLPPARDESQPVDINPIGRYKTTTYRNRYISRYMFIGIDHQSL